MNSTSGLPSAQQALLAGLRDQGLQQVAADPAGEAAAYARQALDRLCTDFADPPVDEALLAECTDLFAELDGDAERDRGQDQHTTSAVALQRALTERLRERAADDDDAMLWRRAAQTGARLRAAIEAGRPPERPVPPGAQVAITADSLTEYLRARLPGAESVDVIDLDVLARRAIQNHHVRAAVRSPEPDRDRAAPGCADRTGRQHRWCHPGG